MIVRCDNPACRWKAETKKPALFLHKPCPRCGTGPLINRQDLRVYRAVKFYILINWVMAWMAELMGKKTVDATLSLDTGPLRDGRLASIRVRLKGDRI